jgi:hypothetical protein
MLCAINLGLAAVVMAAEPVAQYTVAPATLTAKAEARVNPPIAHTAPVTKACYLDTARVFFKGKEGNADYWLRQPKPYPEAGMYLDFARWYAMMYHLTGTAAYAERAVKALACADTVLNDPALGPNSKGIHFQYVDCAVPVDAWLSASPAYTPAARAQWIAAISRAYSSYLETEYGSFNRPFLTACGAEHCLALNPKTPDADKWRKYIELIWGQFWEYRDTDEDSDEYNALSLLTLLNWVDARGNGAAFWSDPAVKRLMETFLYKVTPMGAYPNMPDSMGWNVPWGHYIYIFEACATHYRDGRFKWAAHRLYDYAVNRIESLNSWAYSGEFAGWSLLKAYEIADDTIAEVPRDRDVVLLQRHRVVQRPWDDIVKTKQWFDIHAEMMPDKLLFNGGAAPDSMSLYVDTSPNVGHSHGKRPYLITLCDRGSTLLLAPGYTDRNAEEHSMPLLRDYEGYLYDNTPYNTLHDNNTVQEAVAVDLGAAGYGRVGLGKFCGYPANLDRDIVFIKNVGVLVKDTLTLGIDLKVRWGSQYRVRNVGPDTGDNWANTYLGDWVPVRGLGAGTPVLTRWKNPARDLLVYYLPDAESRLELMDDSALDKTKQMPLRVMYTQRRPCLANAPTACTTLLLPHNPGPGKPLADKVKVLLNEPLRTVVEFTDDAGATHLVVLNTAGTPLKLANLATDARVACVTCVNGKVQTVARYGGKTLTLNGQNLAGKAPAPKVNVVP